MLEPEPGPSPEDWRPLFVAATKILELAPWRCLDEATVFGVQEPGSGQVNYVSVMGRLGEHHAVALYLGAAGLHGFLDMHWSAGRRVDAETVLTIPQLQLSFEERGMLTDADRAVLRRLGRRCHGVWPLCRNYVPGYVPRPLTAAEIPVLTLALEITLAVAPTLTNDPPDTKPTTIPVYVPVCHAPGRPAWRVARRPLPPPPPAPPLGMIPPDVVAALRELPATSAVIEAGLAMQLLPTREPGVPPFYPFALLLAAADNGMILGMELLQPVPDLAAMRTAVPGCLARTLIGLGRKPAELRLADPALAAACRPLDEAGIAVAQVARVPAFDAARRELDGFLAGHHQRTDRGRH